MKLTLLELLGLLLASALIVLGSGCTTTTTPEGSTTKQVDKEAIAQAVAIVFEALHDPVVSNAVWQATQKK